MTDTPTDETPAEEAAAPSDAAVAPTEEAEPPAPSDELREGIVERLRAELGDSLVDTHISPGDDLWIRVDTAAWREAAAVVQGALGCTYFDFLSAIDWLPSPFGRDMDSQEDLVTQAAAGPGSPAAKPQGAGGTAKPAGEMTWGLAGGASRFQVLARVASPTQHYGITLKADLDDAAPTVDTWVPVYAGADWHEREAFEMYGITFTGHPGLKKIYLPGDFEGNPLRKDFPLLARRVKPWPGIVDVEQMPGEPEPTETEEPADA